MTPKQSRFIAEYVVDLNGTQAAIRAGYSERTARAIASELLTKPDVQAAIADAQNARTLRTEVDQDWIIRRLVQVVRRGKRSGQLAAVNKALELLGRHLGMFKDRFEVAEHATLMIVEEIVDSSST